MAGPTTDKSGQIQRSNGSNNTSLAAMLGKMQHEIARALPRHVTPDRMLRISLTALRQTPKLAVCTPTSFLSCVMSAAQLGLEPNTPLGHVYLIPRENRKAGVTECTMIIGYQGMLELSRRSGMIETLTAEVVREGDHFVERKGTSPELVHEPANDAERDSRPITHVYAVAWVKGSKFPSFRVMSRGEIERRKDRSAAGKYGPWTTDWEEMAKKTVIRALWKLLPKSSEVAIATGLDEAPETGVNQIHAMSIEVTDALKRNDIPVEELPLPDFSDLDDNAIPAGGES